MVFFTTLAGAAQGLLLALVALQLAGTQAPTLLYASGAAVALVLSCIGLVAATFHLGRPSRAWRSAAMWRTSWLSREVIVLPAFIAATAAWALATWFDAPATPALGVVAALLAFVLYLCTGMIYGAVKAIPQWAHPITPTNYALLGIASGLTLAAALAALYMLPVAAALARAALLATLLGAATRGWSLWRNLHLVSKTDLQSAIGVRHPRIVQKAQGSMGGSFNTREFFHGRSDGVVTQVRWVAALCGFVLPALLLALGASATLLAAAFVVQYLGLLAERWSFFAEGQHTQNLYYRTIS